MRKRQYAALWISAVLMLTGCGNAIPDMTEEQLQAVGEYTAQLLLSNDGNYQSRLVDVELLEMGEDIDSAAEETPEETPAPENAGMDPVEDTPIVNLAESQENESRGTVSLEEALGLQELMTLSYTGYEVADSYPVDASAEEYFSVDAGEGSKLLVLHFILQNQGEGTETADTLHQNLVVKVSVNGISTYSLTSLLGNDLTVYQESLNPGESRELVILAKYESQALQDVASIEINVKNENENAAIRLE